MTDCEHGPGVLCRCKLEKAMTDIQTGEPGYTHGFINPISLGEYQKQMENHIRKQAGLFSEYWKPEPKPDELFKLADIPVIVSEHVPPGKMYLVAPSPEPPRRFFTRRTTAFEVETHKRQHDLYMQKMIYSLEFGPMRGLMTGIVDDIITNYRPSKAVILQHMIHRVGIMNVTLDIFIERRAKGIAGALVNWLFGKKERQCQN